MIKNLQFALVLFFVCLSVQVSADEPHSYRTWEDSTGKYKIDAVLVKRDGNLVHLKRKDNGKVITISTTRLSRTDQTYLKQALSKRSESSQPKSDKKSLYQVDEKISFKGNWNNRKYGTNGALNCLAIVKNDKTWSAKFDGTGVYGKFSYDVVISTKKNGQQIQLQGNSTVSGHKYKWSGYIKNGILFGKYTATNGNNGTFRLEQVVKK